MVKHLIASATLVAALALLALSAIPVAPGVADVKSPAGSGSAEPNLATGPDGRVYMTWIEPAQGKGNVLYFSTLQSQAWSAPKVISRGTNWFVNAADFPSMTVMPGGVLASHWLVSSEPDSEAYDINLSFSKDGGIMWSKPQLVLANTAEPAGDTNSWKWSVSYVDAIIDRGLITLIIAHQHKRVITVAFEEKALKNLLRGPF